MTSIALEEGRHAAAFVMSEASGNRSRDNGTLVSGQNLTAGTVVMDNGSGKLTVYTGTNSSGDEAIGILLYDVDATSADKACSYIARDAEVNLKLLTYPEETTSGDEEANTIASLKLLHIIARD